MINGGKKKGTHTFFSSQVPLQLRWRSWSVLGVEAGDISIYSYHNVVFVGLQDLLSGGGCNF
jgi:hypothetical protein